MMGEPLELHRRLWQIGLVEQGHGTVTGPDGLTHRALCPQILASTCAIPVECEHGYDCCPSCDSCTCPANQKEKMMGNLYRKLRAVIHEAAQQMKRKTKPRKPRLARASAGLLLILAPCALAITNGAAPAISDTRFDAVGAFAVTWRLGLSFGHVDDADNAWFCTATLIDEQTILTAAHCLTPYGQSAPYAVRFRRQTDGSLGTIAAGVLSFYHAYVASWSVYGDDQAYGTLVDPVEHIAPIPILEGATLGLSIIQAGWGRQGPTFGAGPATELRLCNNQIFEILAQGRAYYGQPYLGWGPGLYPNPCGSNSWDSGAPLLAYSNVNRGPASAGGPGPDIFPVVVGTISDEYSGPLFAPAFREMRKGRRALPVEK